jgi:hypothetical protein
VAWSTVASIAHSHIMDTKNGTSLRGQQAQQHAEDAPQQTLYFPMMYFQNACIRWCFQNRGSIPCTYAFFYVLSVFGGEGEGAAQAACATSMRKQTGAPTHAQRACATSMRNEHAQRACASAQAACEAVIVPGRRRYIKGPGMPGVRGLVRCWQQPCAG